MQKAFLIWSINDDIRKETCILYLYLDLLQSNNLLQMGSLGCNLPNCPAQINFCLKCWLTLLLCVYRVVYFAKKQWLPWHGFHGILGTHQFLKERTKIYPISSSKHARDMQHAQWTLNKIENTFNRTFTGWKRMLQGYKQYFFWNPRLKAIETAS